MEMKAKVGSPAYSDNWAATYFRVGRKYVAKPMLSSCDDQLMIADITHRKHKRRFMATSAINSWWWLLVAN